MAMGSAGSNMMSSAPPPNPTAVYSQQLQQGNMYGGGTMGDASGGYQQQNVRVNRMLYVLVLLN